MAEAQDPGRAAAGSEGIVDARSGITAIDRRCLAAAGQLSPVLEIGHLDSHPIRIGKDDPGWIPGQIERRGCAGTGAIGQAVEIGDIADRKGRADKAGATRRPVDDRNRRAGLGGEQQCAVGLPTANSSRARSWTRIQGLSARATTCKGAPVSGCRPGEFMAKSLNLLCDKNNI